MNPKLDAGFGGSSVEGASSSGFFRSVGGFKSSSSSFGAKSPCTKINCETKTRDSKANVRNLLSKIDEVAMMQSSG